MLKNRRDQHASSSTYRKAPLPDWKYQIAAQALHLFVLNAAVHCWKSKKAFSSAIGVMLDMVSARKLSPPCKTWKLNRLCGPAFVCSRSKPNCSNEWRKSGQHRQTINFATVLHPM